MVAMDRYNSTEFGANSLRLNKINILVLKLFSQTGVGRGTFFFIFHNF